jgi:putative acetyltransferase
VTAESAARIRDACDGDAAGLIALIGSVFAEYPGCVLDVDGEAPELRAIARSFAALGGRFWVAEREGRVVGSVGLLPGEAAGGVELRKLYVHRSVRRRGLGRRLCERVEDEARRRGARFVELWSDTRFEDAHRLYEKRGYLRGRVTRELHDLSGSVERYFRRALA